METVIQEHDAIATRALLLAGLDVDSRYDKRFIYVDYWVGKGATLLHWAAACNALECTKVRDVLSTVLHRSCRIKRLGVLQFPYTFCLAIAGCMHFVDCRKCLY